MRHSLLLSSSSSLFLLSSCPSSALSLLLSSSLFLSPLLSLSLPLSLSLALLPLPFSLPLPLIPSLQSQSPPQLSRNFFPNDIRSRAAVPQSRQRNTKDERISQ